MEKTNKQLEKLNEKLKQDLADTERADQAKTDYVSQIARNIRIPMNHIAEMTAAAQANIGDNARARECLEQIECSGRRINLLLNEMTDICELNSHALVLQERAFFLREMLWQLAARFSGAVRKKGLVLRLVSGKVIHEHLQGDTERIGQILCNLISNAVKYSYPGGIVTVKVNELHSFQNNFSLFRFEITDQGVGMTKEFMEKMYLPFERADDPRISKEQGAGLGLPIAVRLVRLMTGDIMITSPPEGGTKCTVTLHLRRQGEKKAPGRYQSCAVLLAAETKEEGEEAVELLRKNKLQADYVLRSEVCLDKLQEAKDRGEPFSAVLINWKMPEGSGLELAREIGERMGQEAPGIIFISNEWENVQEEEKAMNFADFITRPITLPKIFFAMERICPKAIAEEIRKQRISSMAGKRVLLAEDNELNAEIVKELLVQNGVVVDTADNGLIVLDYLKNRGENYYDCILMDVQMPVMNGYVATQKIRKSERPDLKKIPIIAMTTDAFSVDIKRAREVGMNAHVAKPFEIESLLEVFMKIL